MSSKGNIALMGLPSTGKTTYLAALWHIIESPRLKSSLKLVKVDEGSKYLQKIHNEWVQCNEFERTKIGFEGKVNIQLKSPEFEGTFKLSLLDPSGESYKNLFEKRICDAEHARSIKNSSGVLFFIHPGKIKRAESIESANAIIHALSVEEETSPQENQPSPWKPEYCPTQVSIVDLLQFVMNLKIDKYPIPLSVIVSAWDLLQDQEDDPEIWLENTLPLFHQYIKANSNFLSMKIYGISAIGGKLSEDREKLLKIINPEKRIIIKEGTKISNDISLPIKWILSQTKK